MPAYGFMMATGIIFAGAMALRRVKQFGLSPEDVLITMSCALGLGFLGGSIVYSGVTYSWKEILQLLQAGNMTALLGGGLVFYGSLVGGFGGTWLGCWIAKASLSDVILCILPSIPLAHTFGRIGCFLAGCCYGVSTDLCIGVKFFAPIAGTPVGIALIPVQLIEAVLNLSLFAFLLWHTTCQHDAWSSLFLYTGFYSAFRFLLEFWRGDSIRGIWGGISTSQWISLALILVTGAHLIWRRMWRGCCEKD